MLVQIVVALVACLSMQLSNLLDRLLASVRSSLLSGKFLLCPCEFGFCFAIVTRILDHITSGECCQLGHPQIYADYFICVRCTFDLLNLASQADVPVISLSFDGASFDDPLHLAMEFHLDRSDFGEHQFSTLNGKTRLRIGERVVTVLPLESGESRNLTTFHPSKEGFHGLIDTPERILQYLRMDLFVLLPDLLNLRELVRLRIVGCTRFCILVDFASFL